MMQNPYEVTAESTGDARPLELPFTLSGSLTPEEIRSITRPATSSGIWVSRALILLVIAIALSRLWISAGLQIIASSIASDPLGRQALLLYAVVLVPTFFWALALTRVHAARRRLKEHDDALGSFRTLAFTNEGIELLVEDASSRWKWRAVKSAQRKLPVGTISLGSGSLAGEIWVAKQWFASGSQWNEFWELVDSKHAAESQVRAL